jgi:hypothetical protein
MRAQASHDFGSSIFLLKPRLKDPGAGLNKNMDDPKSCDYNITAPRPCVGFFFDPAVCELHRCGPPGFQ